MNESIDTRLKGLPRHLFWDMDLDYFDWEKWKNLIIERIIQRGNLKDWEIMEREYGREEIVDTIKRLSYLNDRDIQYVSVIYDIPKESMKCYIKKLSVPIYWNS